MVESDITLFYIVAAYLVVMMGVGVWAYKKTNTAEDFLLAGRSLGAVIIAGTLMATWMGSGTVTGGPTSIGYANGFVPAILFMTAALIGIIALKLLAPRIRAGSEITIPEMLEEALGWEGRAIGMIVIAFAYVGIVSYQFIGFGFVLNVSTGVSVTQGTIIGAVVIISLAAMGGLMSVSYTDAISAFLMIFGLIVAVPFVLSSAGGWGNIVAETPDTHTNLLGDLTFLQFMGFWAPFFLLILGDQNMYQRILAGDSDESSNRGIIGWFIGVGVAMSIIPVFVFASRAMFPELGDPGMALVAITTVIPTWIGGLLLAAVSAFIITTGSSYLLSASTNISHDLYSNFVNPDASSSRVAWFTRGLVIALGIFAFVLGEFFPTILELQMYSYTAYGAAITVPLMAVFLMRKRLTKAGGISGMLVGASIAIAWDPLFGTPIETDAVVIAAPAALASIFVVSYLTRDGEAVAEPTEVS